MGGAGTVDDSRDLLCRLDIRTCGPQFPYTFPFFFQEYNKCVTLFAKFEIQDSEDLLAKAEIRHNGVPVELLAKFEIQDSEDLLAKVKIRHSTSTELYAKFEIQDSEELLGKIIIRHDVPPQPPYSGAVMVLHMDEGFGTNTGDSSGQGNDGTLNNCAWVDGRFKKALDFDGLGNDWITCGTDSSIKPASALSLECWFKTADLGVYRRLISDIDTTLKRGYDVFIRNTGVITFQLGIDGSYVWSNSQNAYDDGAWHHLICTWGGGLLRIYVDGLEVSYSVQGTTAAYTVSALTTYIGRYAGGTYFDGIIDESQIYNRVLSPGEVLTRYLNGSLFAKAVIRHDGVPVEFLAKFEIQDSEDLLAKAKIRHDGTPVELLGKFEIQDSEALFAKFVVRHTVPCQPGPDVLWLPMDEGEGIIAYDKSGLGHDGTLTKDNGSLPAWSRGHTGHAINLLGQANQGYVDCGDIDEIDNATALTTLFWLYRNINDWRTIVRKEGVLTIRVKSADGHLTLSYTGVGALEGTSSIPLTTWTQIAHTFDSAEDNLYVNENLEASGNGGQLAANANPFVLGLNDNGPYYVNARVDGVQVYSRRLSGRQIRDLFFFPHLYVQFKVRHPASAELACKFEIQDSEDLAGKVTIRHSASTELAAKFEIQDSEELFAKIDIRHPAATELLARIKIRHTGPAPPELLGKFVVRHDEPSPPELLAKVEIRHSAPWNYGFESLPDHYDGLVQTVSGTESLAADNVIFKEGAWSSKSTIGGAGDRLYASVTRIFPATLEIQTQHWFRTDTLPAAVQDNMILTGAILATGGQYFQEVGLRYDGGQVKWSMGCYEGGSYVDGREVSTLGPTPQVNTWYLIEERVKVHATQGEHHLYVNRVPVISRTGKDTTGRGALARFRFGCTRSDGQACIVHVDWGWWMPIPPMLPAQLTVRHDGIPIELLAKFEIQDSEDLLAKAKIRHPDTVELLARIKIRHEGPSPPELLAKFGVRQPASAELLGRAEIRHPASTELSARAEIRHPSSAELLGRFSVRQPASTELLANAEIRHPSSVELLTNVDIRHPGSAELLAKFEIQDSEDLLAKIDIRHPAAVEFFARIKIRHEGPSPPELLAKFGVRQPASAELLGKIEIRQSTSVELLSRCVIRHDGIPIELLGKCVIRHPASAELLGKIEVRHPASVELLANAEIRHPGSAELLTKFEIQDSEDLLAKAKIRHPDTVELFARTKIRHEGPSPPELLIRFNVKQPASAELLGRTDIRHPASTELSIRAEIRHPSSTELLARFEIQDSEDLLGKIEIRHSASTELLCAFGVSHWEDLLAKAEIRHPDTIELLGKIRIRHEGPAPPELLAKFYARHPDFAELFGRLEVRHPTSVELLAKIKIRHPDSAELLARLIVRGLISTNAPFCKFVVRHTTSKELLAHAEIRFTGIPIELLVKTNIRQSASSELLAKAKIRQSLSTELLAKASIRQPGSTELLAKFDVRQPASTELLAKIEIRHSVSAELPGKFIVRHTEPSPPELLAKVEIRQSSSTELLANAEIRQPGSAELLAKFEIQDSEDLLAKIDVRQSTSVELPVRLVVRGIFFSNAPFCKFVVRHTISLELSGKAEIRHPDTAELLAHIEIRQTGIPVELLGKIDIRQPASVDLLARAQIRQTASVELLGKIKIRHTGIPVELLCKTRIRHVGISHDLLAHAEIRQPASVELLGRARIRHIGIPAELFGKTRIRHEGVPTELLGKANIRHPASAELLGRARIRHPASAELLAKITIRHDSSAELSAKFEIQDSEDLLCKADIRHSASTELLGRFEVRHSASVELFCTLGVSHWEDLLAGLWVRHPYRLWTNRRYLNGVVELNEQTLDDALLEGVIEGVMNDIRSRLINEEKFIYDAWTDITKTPKLIRRATTYGAVATLYSRDVNDPLQRIVLGIRPVVLRQVRAARAQERAMNYWEDRMETMITLFLTSLSRDLISVDTEDEEPVFTLEDIPFTTEDPYKILIR